MTPDEIRGLRAAKAAGEKTEDRWLINSVPSNGNARTTYRTVTPFLLDKFGKLGAAWL